MGTKEKNIRHGSLDCYIQRLQHQISIERNRRIKELAWVAKSLLRFENKLNLDKNIVNQKLQERDTEICRLVSLNKSLRNRSGNDDGDGLFEQTECTIPEALMCRKCRSEFYEIGRRNNSTQTKISDNSSDSATSSEAEDTSSFYEEVKQNVTSTSKRARGTFQHYKKLRDLTRMSDSFHNEDIVSSSRRKNYSFSEEPDDFNKPEENLDNITLNNQEFEISTDDWYASASEAEDIQQLPNKQYGCSTINPVLECVNQILLQQSMDENISDRQAKSSSYEDFAIKLDKIQHTKQDELPENIPKKRVHFSTKNSMVQCRAPSSFSNQQVDVVNIDNVPNYESIYSNGYEMIGSELNTSGLYIDMDAKSPEDKIQKADKLRKPPALPPKPPNLIKFERKPNAMNFSGKDKRTASSESVIPAVEPDYCFISELNVEIPTKVHILADVHKASSESNYSSINQDTAEEIFSDIPKLPNVAAIMAPKISPIKSINIEKFNTTPINWIPKVALDVNTTMYDHKLYIVNKQMETPKLDSSILSTNSVKPSSVAIKGPIEICRQPEQLPMQDEFDWYNLDVEFGNAYQSSQDNTIDENVN